MKYSSTSVVKESEKKKKSSKRTRVSLSLKLDDRFSKLVYHGALLRTGNAPAQKPKLPPRPTSGA
jgi:hypothetical protein